MPATDYPHRSTDIQEIIGQIPPWTVRWGISVIFAVFLILLFCANYIRYPDVLPGNVTISTREQPFQISWYRSGPHVHRVHVREHQQVKVSDTLLTEENLLDHKVTPVLSPVAGKVIFLKGTADSPRKSSIVVYPRLTTPDVQLYLPFEGSGKVHPGQKVLIHLDAYPSDDFGVLEGQIVSLLLVQFKDKYRADVRLLDGLRTRENKVIPPQHILTGRAEVVLEDRNLFARLFGSVF